MRRGFGESEVAHSARCLAKGTEFDSAKLLEDGVLVLIVDHLLLHLGQLINELLALLVSFHQCHLQPLQHVFKIVYFRLLQASLLLGSHYLVLQTDFRLFDLIFLRINLLFLLPYLCQLRL
jgi:hypothetical protein